MVTDAIQLSIDSGVAMLILNRPDIQNAFDNHMIRTLSDHLYQLQHNDAVRMLVLKGAGDHFSSGANIQWMRQSLHFNKEQNHQDALKLAELLYTLYHFPKPTIALVKGNAFGGALGLIASCDIAIASETAKFSFSEVKLGLIPAVVSPYVLKALGERECRRYMLTAEVFTASIAEKIGLIHEMVNINHLEERLWHFIEKIKQNGPNALKAMKSLFHTLEETKSALLKMEATADLIANIRVSIEAQEGLLAFLEKRPPNWQEN